MAQLFLDLFFAFLLLITLSGILTILFLLSIPVIGLGCHAWEQIQKRRAKK